MRMRSPLLVIAVAMSLLAARSAWAAGSTPPSLQPAGWDAALQLPEPTDRNPDPRIIEIDVTARVAEVEVAPGSRVKAWTYDGLLPGPFIRAKVGDRLIVHFTNNLPEPSTITGTACGCRSRWTACPASRSQR
jgi:FtsP/CotA-like multicopper oxidase with cupredoxin domain